MIPDIPHLSNPTMYAEFMQPYNTTKVPLKDYARGGVALLDGTNGLNVKNWSCEVTDGEVFVTAEGTPKTSVYQLDPAVSWVSLAFDGNMHFNLAYIVDNESFLYWYDADSRMYITTSLGNVITPFIRMDDVRLYIETSRDIILSYIRNKALCVRMQRDRFGVEYVLANNAGSRLLQCGMNVGRRFQWKCI